MHTGAGGCRIGTRAGGSPIPAPLTACCNAREDVRETLAAVVMGECFHAVTHDSPSSLGSAPTIALLHALARVEQPHTDPTEASMRRNTVGGYQGPVEILTCEDVLLGQAACRYRAEEDAAGVDHWQGRLHRINAPDGVQAGAYRLRFDGGRHGDITVRPAEPGDRVVYFDGVGARPL